MIKLDKRREWDQLITDPSSSENCKVRSLTKKTNFSSPLPSQILHQIIIKGVVSEYLLQSTTTNDAIQTNKFRRKFNFILQM